MAYMKFCDFVFMNLQCQDAVNVKPAIFAFAQIIITEGDASRAGPSIASIFLTGSPSQMPLSIEMIVNRRFGTGHSDGAPFVDPSCFPAMLSMYFRSGWLVVNIAEQVARSCRVTFVTAPRLLVLLR